MNREVGDGLPKKIERKKPGRRKAGLAKEERGQATVEKKKEKRRKEKGGGFGGERSSEGEKFA